MPDVVDQQSEGGGERNPRYRILRWSKSLDFVVLDPHSWDPILHQSSSSWWLLVVVVGGGGREENCELYYGRRTSKTPTLTLKQVDSLNSASFKLKLTPTYNVCIVVAAISIIAITITFPNSISIVEHACT